MKKKKEFGLITLAFITILLLSQFALVSAITGSMGNARMVLYPEVNGLTNTIIEKSILVKNVNEVPITIKLEVDESSTEFLELVDTDVELEPGTEKRMAFKVKVKKPGRYDGKINVFFSESEGEGPGVALASNIIIIAKNPNDSGYDNQDDDENDNSNEVNSDNEDPITGDVTSENSEKRKPIGALLTITTVILIVALIVLYFLSEKKMKSKKDIEKKKVEEIKEKKRKKSNETSKKKTKK